jgi:hypothetical protein
MVGFPSEQLAQVWLDGYRQEVRRTAEVPNDR